jgi:organic hydroperoxide reductase OsmC/OhrA
MKTHRYQLTTIWTGNTGSGTTSYTAYSRNYTVECEGKPELLCSSDPVFRGDPQRYNPEELFLAALSGCHMLWYLHLCSDNGIAVVDYRDQAQALLVEGEDGLGKFKSVTLKPVVLIREGSKVEEAIVLHKLAHKKCFIANSCNFAIDHEPEVQAAE